MNCMCLTCRIIQGEYSPPGGVIYEDEYLILHHCIDVFIPGYLILSPKRHTEHFHALSDAEIRRFGVITQAITGLVNEIPDVGKVYIASFCEESSHIHFHIFPRYNWIVSQGHEYIVTEGRLDGAKLLSWARQQYKTSSVYMSDPSILEVVTRLKAKLNQYFGSQYI